MLIKMHQLILPIKSDITGVRLKPKRATENPLSNESRGDLCVYSFQLIAANLMFLARRRCLRLLCRLLRVSLQLFALSS